MRAYHRGDTYTERDLVLTFIDGINSTHGLSNKRVSHTHFLTHTYTHSNSDVPHGDTHTRRRVVFSAFLPSYGIDYIREIKNA